MTAGAATVGIASSILAVAALALPGGGPDADAVLFPLTTFSRAANLSATPGSSKTPDVAGEGSEVYVTWYDSGSADGVPDIYLRRSTDEGAASTFEPAVNLSANAGGSLLPRVAVSGPDVYVVWEDDSDSFGTFDVYFRRSRDGGETWDPAVNLSATPTRQSTRPVVAATGPEVYVAWEEVVGAATTQSVAVRVRRSLNQGGTFGKAVDVSGKSEGDSIEPALAATGSAVYLVWSSRTLQPTDQIDQVYLRRSLNEATSWEPAPTDPPLNVSRTTGPTRTPSVAASGAAVIVAWEDRTKLAGDVLYNLSTDAAESFPFDSRFVAPTPGRSTSPRVAAIGSRFEIAWADSSPGRIDVLLKAFDFSGGGGITEHPTERVTSGGLGYAEAPGLALAGLRSYVAWQVRDGGPADVFFTRRLTAGSVPRTNLSDTPGRPSLTPATSTSGRDVYVAWANTGVAINLDVFVRVSTDGGTSFGPPVNLSNNFGTSRDPAIASSGQVVYVVWSDDNGLDGVPDIVFRRSLDHGLTWDPPLSAPPENLSQLAYGLSETDVSRVPTIAAAGSELYVAWEDYTQKPASIEETPQILFRRALQAAVPGPVLWDPPLYESPDQLTCSGAKLCRSFTPSLAAAGANVYLAWQLDLLGKKSIQLKLRTDEGPPKGGGGTAPDACGGTTLDGPVGVVAKEPDVAAAGSSIYVVWLRGDKLRYRRALVDGLTCVWDPPLDAEPGQLALNFFGGHARDPADAATGLDFYAVWAEDEQTHGGSFSSLAFARSKNGGGTVSTLGALSETTAIVDDPDVAAAGGRVYPVWAESSPDDFFSDVFLRASANEGSSFP